MSPHQLQTAPHSRLSPLLPQALTLTCGTDGHPMVVRHSIRGTEAVCATEDPGLAILSLGPRLSRLTSPLRGQPTGNATLTLNATSLHSLPCRKPSN